MKYDLNNSLQRNNAKERFNELLEKGGIIELTLISGKRTIRQNKYLHLIINLFASEYGETSEYVKQYYFKLTANREIFLREKHDPFLGKVKYLRSTSELDKEEMQVAIERFRNWSSMNGIYLPSSEEHRLLQLAEIEISKNKNYL